MRPSTMLDTSHRGTLPLAITVLGPFRSHTQPRDFKQEAEADPQPVVQRPVRMILIEHLQGCSIHSLMFDSNAYYPEDVRDTYHETYRLHVWTKILEALAYFGDARLDDDDAAPRNVMLVPEPTKLVPLSQQPLPRVVLIDFGLAVVYDRIKLKDARVLPQPTYPLPDNHLQDWWHRSAYHFSGRVPDWYEEDDQRCKGWLIEQFGGKNARNWAPLFKNHRLDAEDIELCMKEAAI